MIDKSEKKTAGEVSKISKSLSNRCMIVKFGAKHRACPRLERLAPKKYCQISMRQNFPVIYDLRGTEARSRRIDLLRRSDKS